VSAKLFRSLDHNTSPHYSRRRCALERQAGQLSRFLTTAGAPAERFNVKNIFCRAGFHFDALRIRERAAQRDIFAADKRG